MTSEQLNEFYILSTTLNYSETAQKLFISQSTLSRHIKSMEEELGVHLFLRDTRNVVLTSEGKFFQLQLPRLLKKVMDIESLVHLKSITTNGSVKILAAPQTLNTNVLQFLRNFQNQYKNIGMEILPTAQCSAIDQIYSTDILISPSDFIKTKPADIDSMLVATQSALLAIPPYHHFGEKSQISLSDLGGEVLIIPHADNPADPYVQLSLMAKRKCYGLVNIASTTEDHALLQVELGHGVMIIPHHLKHHVYAHTQTIPISDLDCFFPIYVYHNLNNQNGAAILFYKSMMKYFQKSSL